MTRKDKGWAKKTEGQTGLNSKDNSLAVGINLQRSSAPPPPPGVLVSH